MSESKIVYKPSETTHWRTFYESKTLLLGSHNLNPGEELIAVIESIGNGEVLGDKGTPETVAVLKLKDTPPMVMNITNARTLSALYGDYTEKWIGKRIQIYATAVKAFGKEVEALRIRPKIPAERNDIQDGEKSLRGCKTIAELQSVFMRFPKPLQASLVSVKDGMKKTLSPEDES